MNKIGTYNFGLLLTSTFFITLSLGLFFNSHLQQIVHETLYPKQRTVIATLETDLNVPSLKYKIIKVQSGKEIWIEIYDLIKTDAQVVAFKMNAKADGQMSVNNKTSPLFASDLNGDSILEVVAPTFGLEFQPQVHAFKFNPKNGDFVKMSNKKLIDLL